MYPSACTPLHFSLLHQAGAEESFKLLSQAYEVLSDMRQRGEYDRQQQVGVALCQGTRAQGRVQPSAAGRCWYFGKEVCMGCVHMRGMVSVHGLVLGFGACVRAWVSAGACIGHVLVSTCIGWLG